MASVTVVISAVNNGQSHVDLTFNDVTLAVSQIAWTNPSGHWTFTLTQAGKADITRTLNPGDSGSQAIPNGYNWSNHKATPPSFGWSDQWTAS